MNYTNLKRVICTYFIQYILAGIISCPLLLAAPPSKPISPNKIPQLTLEDAILLAMRNAPQIVSARLNLVLDKYNIAVQRNVFNLQPSLSMSVAWQPNNTPIYYTQPGLTLKTPWGSTLGVTKSSTSLQQSLYKGFSPSINRVPLDNALDQQTSNQLAYLQTVSDNVRDVIVAYYQALAAQDSKQLSDQAVQQSEKTLKGIRLLIEAGDQPRLAGKEQELQLLQEQMNQLTAQANVSAAITQLKILIDLDQRSLIDLSPLKWPPNKLPPLSQYQQLAKDHNLTLKSNQLQLRPLLRNLAVAKDNLKWQVDLSATQSYGRNPSSPIKSAGITVTVPINDVTSKQAYVAAQIALTQAKETLKTSEQAIALQINTQYDVLLKLKQSIPLAKKRVEHAKQVYVLTLQSVVNGLTPANDITTKKQTLIQSQEAIFSLEIQYLTALAEMQALTGTLLENYHVDLHTS